ncbi:MAG: hypothetical protein QXF59_05265 [Candidatus Bathyarchaeia archaeon]
MKSLKNPLIIFACAIAISAFAIYYTHQLPAFEVRTETLCTYQHNGTYDYIAKLKPNIIYSNKTILGPGEGTPFTQRRPLHTPLTVTRGQKKKTL